MAEKSPEITIITPVYNMERYLRRCIESVLAQTFTDFELLLVDDGSTDSSPEICDEYARKDARVRVIHKPNTGVADTRNVAVASASGRFVGFVDSDDWIDAGMYETLHDNILRYDADIAVCGYTYEWLNRSKSRHDESGEVRVFSRDEALALIFADTPLQSMLCDKLFRREIIGSEFPLNYFFEDHATTIKWFARAGRVVFDPRSFYHYRMRGGSTVNGENPERRYHFLVAEIGRAKFLQSIGFLDAEDPSAGASRVLAAAIDTAKKIARSGDSYDIRRKYLERIRHDIEPYMSATETTLNSRQQRRLDNLVRHPDRFMRTVRFSYLFGFSRRNKEKNLFP